MLLAHSQCRPVAVCDHAIDPDLPKGPGADVPVMSAPPFSETEGVLYSLARMLEQRDSHTAGHCGRLAISGVALGLAWPEHEVEVVGKETIARPPHGRTPIGVHHRLHESRLVIPLAEDPVPRVPTIDDVVYVAPLGRSRCSWHTPILSHRPHSEK